MGVKEGLVSRLTRIAFLIRVQSQSQTPEPLNICDIRLGFLGDRLTDDRFKVWACIFKRFRLEKAEKINSVKTSDSVI